MFKKTKPAASAERIVVPSLESVSPDYAGFLAKRAELQALAATLDAERLEIISKISAGASKNAADARVSELLGEKSGNASTESLRERMAEISRDTGSITRALDILRERISDARGAASRAVCDAVRPAVAERVQTFVAFLAAAADAGREIERILDDLELSGVAWVGPIPPLRTRWLTDGRAPSFAKDALEAGMISEVPEVLR